MAWVGGEAWRPPLYDSTDAMAEIELDASIGAVVVGWDPHFSYSRLVSPASTHGVCMRLHGAPETCVMLWRTLTSPTAYSG